MSVHTFRHFLMTLVVALLCTSCSRENPQELKKRTAHITAELKRDAKAIASGVNEGWGQYKTQDVNTATKEQLMTLPGVTAVEADRIIAGRPYNRTDELLTRHIMSKKEYDRVSDLLKVGKR